MVVKWHAEGTTKLLQLILNNPVWRNALFSQSIFNPHKQSLTTQAITIEMFHDDTGWRHEMSREGMIEIKQDGSVVATAKWSSRFPDPVRNRLYTIKEWMKKGKFVKEFGVDPAWTRWKQIPKDRREIMKHKYPYYFLLRELVSTDAPYAPPIPTDPARNNDRMDIDEEQEDDDARPQASSSKTTGRKRRRSLDLRTPEPEIVYRPASRTPPHPEEPLGETSGLKKARTSEEAKATVSAQPVKIELDDPKLEPPVSKGSRLAPIEIIEIDDDTSAAASSSPSPCSRASSVDSESASRSFRMSAKPDALGSGDIRRSDKGKDDDARASSIASGTHRDDASGLEDQDMLPLEEIDTASAGTNASPLAGLPQSDFIAHFSARNIGKKKRVQDHLVEAIITQQTLAPPLTEADAEGCFDRGRMFRVVGSLDLSSLTPGVRSSKDPLLHAFHFLLRAFRSAISRAPNIIGSPLSDVDIFLPSAVERTDWLDAVLEVAQRYGGRLVQFPTEASRPICLIPSAVSPLSPKETPTETRRSPQSTIVGYISALNLLRFIDSRRLHRRWVKNSSKKGSNATIVKGATGTKLAASPSWAAFSHLDPEEWFQVTGAHNLPKLCITRLVEDMEIGVTDTHNTPKPRGILLGWISGYSSQQFGDLDVRIRAIARARGIVPMSEMRPSGGTGKKRAKDKRTRRLGMELFYISGIDRVPPRQDKPKGATTLSLLDFVCRLARLPS